MNSSLGKRYRDIAVHRTVRTSPEPNAGPVHQPFVLMNKACCLEAKAVECDLLLIVKTFVLLKSMGHLAIQKNIRCAKQVSL